MNVLIARKFFDLGNHDSSSTTDSNACPALPTPVNDADKVIGEFTVHQFLLIFAAAGGVIAIIVSMLLFFLHAFNLRNPNEQIKIMRIITIIPVFCVIAFANIAIGQHSIFLEPWETVYESLCLCTFYLLVHSYISPTLEGQAEYFAHLPYKRKPNGPVKGDSSSAFWRRSQLLTFQIIPTTILFGIVTDATEAVDKYCINSLSPHFAHIWVSVLCGIFTSVAVYVVIMFTYRLKPEMPDRNIATQLWAFKLIIGINVVQSLGFSFAAGKITPTNTLSYNDIAVGIPNLLLILEMVGFGIFFHKAYSWKRYSARAAGSISKDGNKHSKPVMNAAIASLRALNFFEVFVAMFQIFTGKWKVPGRTASSAHMELLNQAQMHNEEYRPQQQTEYHGYQPQQYQPQQYQGQQGQQWNHGEQQQGSVQSNAAWSQDGYGYTEYEAPAGGPHKMPPTYSPLDNEYERR